MKHTLLIMLFIALVGCQKSTDSDFPISDVYGHTSEFQTQLAAFYGVSDDVFKICSHYDGFCDDPRNLEAYIQGLVGY